MILSLWHWNAWSCFANFGEQLRDDGQISIQMLLKFEPNFKKVWKRKYELMHIPIH